MMNTTATKFDVSMAGSSIVHTVKATDADAAAGKGAIKFADRFFKVQSIVGLSGSASFSAYTVTGKSGSVLTVYVSRHTGEQTEGVDR